LPIGWNCPKRARTRARRLPDIAENIHRKNRREVYVEPVRIPRRVDEPPHLLMWSADELAPMLIGLVIGVVLGKAFICTVIGLVITNLYRRFRDNHPDGYLLHMLYWTGLPMTKSKTFKNPFIRRYFP
jgi:conjugal transfer pilus assembly protein TraL